MTIATFDYDETRVCDTCYTNDGIHYNLFVMHGIANIVPGSAAWCDHCCQDCSLIDTYEIEAEIKRKEERES